MMKNNQKKYKELQKKYSEEDFAEGFYAPKEMTDQEERESSEEIWNIRKKLLEQMSPDDKIYSGLLKLKYQIKNYVESRYFDSQKTISKYLREYMKVLDKNQKELSSDIDIHKTRLSRILNNREKISLQLAYRLEIHSGELIPAILWWKLLQKEIEQEIKEDKTERKKEKKKVKNVAYPSR